MSEVILENKPKLIKWLSSGYDILLQYVQAKKLLTASQYSELIDITVKERGVIKLLDIILGKGEDVCRKFLDLLKEDDVNEFSPELRDWIKTVYTKDQEKDYKRRESSNRPIQETANMTGPSGTKVTINNHSSGGSSIFSPAITGARLGNIEMNISFHPLANYQTPDRDCEHRPIQGYQKFLKENNSKLIQNVKNIDPVIDDLDLHSESVANVRAKPTNQKKMRELLDCVNCESIAKNLYNTLWKHETSLMNELLNN